MFEPEKINIFYAYTLLSAAKRKCVSNIYDNHVHILFKLQAYY